MLLAKQSSRILVVAVALITALFIFHAFRPLPVLERVIPTISSSSFLGTPYLTQPFGSGSVTNASQSDLKDGTDQTDDDVTAIEHNVASRISVDVLGSMSVASRIATGTTTIISISEVATSTTSPETSATIHDSASAIPSTGITKTIVMGKLNSEDTNWVIENLPDWSRAIYIVDLNATSENPTPAPPQGYLRTSTNKAKEALPYLTYLIDNYPDFPDVSVFLHAHRRGWPTAWHNDAWDHDAVIMLNELRLDTVLSRGFVNLRCLHDPGCPEEYHLSLPIHPLVLHANTSSYALSTSLPRVHAHRDDSAESPVEGKLMVSQVYPHVYGHIFNMSAEEAVATVPIIAAPCCAQFAVSREQILQRPREDYIRLRDFLLIIDEKDTILGTVMEYTWHVLFGREAIHCENTATCWREVYGRGR